MYRLFHEFAHRYDFHTPPGHYQHDHAHVIEEANRFALSGCRLLDLGCGTGVFLEAAVAAGIDARGIDASAEMVSVARRRVGEDRVRVLRMQQLNEHNSYDIVCALSWTIHYCESRIDLSDVLRRLQTALRSGGRLLIQVADDTRMTGDLCIEHMPGPSGVPDDTVFIHRFLPQNDGDHRVLAHYVYASRSHRELLFEEHELKFASPLLMIDVLRATGFHSVTVVTSNTVSPFIHATAT